MNYRIIAFYADRDKARLAAEDVQSAGIPPERILFGEGMLAGSGRIEVSARDFDEAINVRTFLQQDGSDSTEMHQSFAADAGDASPTHGTIPPVPFAS